MNNMVTTEIVTKRTREGQPIERITTTFENEVFYNEGGRVVKLCNKVITYYFRTLKAVWWEEDYPNEQHIEDIIVKKH